jgi:hypothetical protein
MGKAGAERAEGSFVRHGGKIADAMNLKTKKTRAFFQDAIDVNKSGLVELVAPRRVVPPVVGRMDIVSGWVSGSPSPDAAPGAGPVAARPALPRTILKHALMRDGHGVLCAWRSGWCGSCRRGPRKPGSSQGRQPLMLLELESPESRKILRDERLVLTTHLNHTANSTSYSGDTFRENSMEPTSG